MEITIKEINKQLKGGKTKAEIARLFDTSQQLIDNRITNRKFLTRRQVKVVYVRYGFICQWGRKCNPKEKQVKNLIIHHIDLDPSNNDYNNLILLCKDCHLSFHKLIRQYKKCPKCKQRNFKMSSLRGFCENCRKEYMEKRVSRWANEYKKCIKCGTIKKKHYGKGLCIICYGRKRWESQEYREKHILLTMNWQKNNPEKVKKYQQRTRNNKVINNLSTNKKI